MNSDKAELVVVYGRRRIGKTFLIRHFFNNKYTFSFVGMHNATKKVQLQEFAKKLQQYSGSAFTPQLSNWNEAFHCLQTIITSSTTKGKKVIFIDEMPWIDTLKSGFTDALENFWNGWASARDDIMFVVCGSATSWMVDKLLHNQGGLFNRVTQKIYLKPFNLYETEQYLNAHHFNYDHYQIAQCYMILGGVPYYLSLLNPKLPFYSNIDALFFADIHATLRDEYNELYASLFRRPEKYISIIRFLAKRKEGFSRQEITTATKISGAALTKILSDLELCDFILPYSRFGNSKNNSIYRIKDFYTLFYIKYVDGIDTKDPHRWSHIANSQQVASWQGFSFELLCLTHLQQIKKALGIDRIINSASAWRSKSNSDISTQIDLVIERADHNINLCEMKFSNSIYAIDKGYERKLRERLSIFCSETSTRCSTRITMVTTFGVLKNKHYGIVDDEVTLQQLFHPEN